jgi:hypothetical protein
MNTGSLAGLLDFLRNLRRARIAYSLRHSRDDAIMVFINVPGERWEVEFMEDGEIEVERFCSNGEIKDESSFSDLFARFSDSERETSSAGNENDLIARK